MSASPIGTVQGPAGILAVVEPFISPTLENEFRVLREASVGYVVFLERLDRHRLADRWVELPVTGVFEVHDGLITYWRDYFDAATIMAQWPARQAYRGRRHSGSVQLAIAKCPMNLGG